jgi:Fe-S cluster assembly protein SufD
MNNNLNTVSSQTGLLKPWEPEQLIIPSGNQFPDPSVIALAKECYLKRGIPNRKDEEYKYSDTTSLFNQPILLGDGSSSGKEISFTPFSEDVYRLVCINGIFQPSLSQVPASIEVLPLTEALAQKGDFIQQYLGKVAPVQEDPFVAINTLQFTGGLFIRVPKGVVVDKAIELIQVFESLDEKMKSLYFPRIFMVMEDFSDLVFFENGQVSTGEKNVLKVGVAEVLVGENARLKYYRLQNEAEGFEQINDLSVHAAANSHVDTNTISLGSSWIRNNLSIRLNGRNSEAHLNGLFITHGRQHMDHHTLVDHRVDHCESNQVYKGVLNGRSTGVFNGKIFVRKDAQKTNAYQSSKNILLSDDATINTKPQLEIYADDVKCSHGSSTGQLDEQAIFYLQARGIGRDAAIQLLIHAFALDVLETIREEKIRAYLAALIGAALENNKL